MKQKPRKLCNGFYSTSQTDLEEMADKERDNSASQDTVHRLSQILSDLKSHQKLSPSEEESEESDLLGLVRDEMECEEFLLKTLYTSVDTVKIYTVSQWSKHKIAHQLKQYQVNKITAQSGPALESFPLLRRIRSEMVFQSSVLFSCSQT